ncbi:putative r3h domain-containing protein [Erysiphe neolycopersici]|uniref:Putative r3h domain-containing protein n=1 Tax=Erysiphe neolycopersici TaxID=212602 RepID=A0A420I5G1_9PEZI|nr:putative r3h domain-containing protein [Erysiphe neolycopersici]
MSTDTSRLSFAKVAASAGKDNSVSFAMIAGSTSRDSRKDTPSSQQIPCIGIDIPNQKIGVLSGKNLLKDTTAPSVNCLQDKQNTYVGSEISESEIKLREAVKALTVTSCLPNLAVNGSGIPSVKLKPKTVGGFSDIFHRVNSSLELGTKLLSIDDKNVTSGTKFVMHDKDSYAPDNSASLKAAEHSEIFSGRGLIIAGSRIGLEASARADHAQCCELSIQHRSISQVQEHGIHDVTINQSPLPGQRLLDERKPNITGVSDTPEGFNLFYRQTPDEKLLEALDSAKDRIFLLRLEQEVIEFVRSSKEPFFELPPCNSFCRMLTHKLADYYHLTHQVDAVAGAVRIFRTPFCRLPPSLTSLSNAPTTGNTPPPATMKIMRRCGDSGPSPSKAASESESDGKEKGISAKEKLSREEREAAYNKARERIFGKEDKNRDATPESEERNEISRSSSLSAKDRTSLNKKTKPLKQRRDDSESFDSRSQYAPFFPQSQGPTWIPSTQYSPIAPQLLNGTNRPFQIPLSPQQYNPATVNFGNMQSFNMTQVVETYPNIEIQYSSPNTQRFQPPNVQNNTYGSPVQSPPLISQQWSQPVYPHQYHQPVSMVRGPLSSIPYAFGQLPNISSLSDPKSQHPIPGSFNRHAFNPKTQSFVPGSVGMPMTQQIAHHITPQHDSPHHSSPRLSYNSFNSSQQQFSNGMGYNMARQNSNNSLPAFHESPLMSHRSLMHQAMQPNSSQGTLPGTLPGMPQNRPQGMNIVHNSQVSNHLPTYGNPSTLPPKPPAGI